MERLKLFEHWTQDKNLYKVAGSESPVIGEPVFTDQESNYEAIQQKINDSLAGYEKHMELAETKTKEWLVDANKGSTQWIMDSQKNRQFAFVLLMTAAKFMKDFNALYKDLREDLLSTDHVKVAKAILKLREIYPYELIRDAGKLKRLRRMKFDAPFFDSVLKWTESIRRVYDQMMNGSKILGKTQKQIAGARKQSINQRMRWGGF